MISKACQPTYTLGLPEKVVNNVLRLIRSVEEAVNEQKIDFHQRKLHPDQTELLDSLIQEYSLKL